MTETLLYHFVGINVVTFFVFGIDKWKAKQGSWRISETTLLLLAVIGGSIGAWLGMKVWRHKTMHKKFKYGIPLILIAQIAMLFLTACATKKQVTTIESANQTPIHKRQPIQEHSPNVFLVMYDAEIGKQYLLEAIKEYGADIKYDYKIINGMAIEKPKNKTLEETMQYFKEVKGVTTVEYDHIIRLTDPVKPRIKIQ